MKKVIALLLLVSIAFSLTGCGLWGKSFDEMKEIIIEEVFNNSDGEKTEYEFLSKTPTHAQYTGSFAFKDFLPSSNPDAAWWSDRLYCKSIDVSSIKSAEDIAKIIKDFVDWDTFKVMQTSELFTVANTKIFTTVHKTNWIDFKGIDFNKVENMTVESAIREGYWSYTPTTLPMDEFKARLGEDFEFTAKWLYQKVGAPSEIYHWEALAGTYTYVLIYQLDGYQIAFTGTESNSKLFGEENLILNMTMFGNNRGDLINTLTQKMTKVS